MDMHLRNLQIRGPKYGRQRNFRIPAPKHGHLRNFRILEPKHGRALEALVDAMA
ncbi:Hypothetical predicted protein [Marmota monax]|uniref:Uncharacterized protein n=1 Tax=Marmota monax TaxID=9995 RepID=A0A5E4BHC0_MARMO|nr:Hypothetical predicted protein [Marmota monax]